MTRSERPLAIHSSEGSTDDQKLVQRRTISAFAAQFLFLRQPSKSAQFSSASIDVDVAQPSKPRAQPGRNFRLRSSTVNNRRTDDGPQHDRSRFRCPPGALFAFQWQGIPAGLGRATSITPEKPVGPNR